MTAITRSASRTPAAISSSNPDASLPCRSGTFCTSMASATGVDPLVLHNGPRFSETCLPDATECGDDRAPAAVLDEPAHRLDLRCHAPAAELAAFQVAAHG